MLLDLGAKRKREENEKDGKKDVKKAKTITTETEKKTTESAVKKTKIILPNSNWDKLKVRIF